MKKIITPYDTMVEKTALALAQAWYEVGRSQGLKSKYKNGREYAKTYFERFIPRAIEHLIECLGPNSTLPNEAKEKIYNCLMSRVNDPDTDFVLPNVDIRKVLAATEKLADRLEQFLEPKPKIPDIKTGTSLSSKENNPFKSEQVPPQFKATRH